VQVWELNPRYGSSKFLDALWASIDEVGRHMQQSTPCVCSSAAASVAAVRAAGGGSGEQCRQAGSDGVHVVQACDLADCDVYSYRMDSGSDADPFSERSAIWSFNYFFYNRRLKRIVYFSCRSLSATAADRALTPGASSTPTASLVTGDRTETRAAGDADSDPEIVGGMDDVS
jgi:hypothetical protein